LQYLKTITTIELASVCNLACDYCINRLLAVADERRPGIMSDMVFDDTLAWLQFLCEAGTQREVNLNGNGESTLDPDLVERTARVKEVMGVRTVQLCTNGLTMTPQLAGELKAAGIDRMDLSPHSPYHARRAIYMLADAGIAGIVTTGAITASHNWAGQLEAEHCIDCRIDLACHPLMEGRGYVHSEGDVTVCCYDYRGFGVYGHVHDADLDRREIRPFALCAGCHQKIPEGIEY
jgi:hypothetical protein